MGSSIFMLVFTLLSIANGAIIPVNNSEPALLAYIFSNYTKEARPVFHVTDPVVVRLGLMLRQIIDVDEKNQIITTNVWIRKYWTDPWLAWDPAKFGGLTSINVEPDKVWKPDILLYNPSSTDLRVGSLYKKIDTKVILGYQGSVTWLSPAILKTECIIDVRYFPFDEQKCPMTFGSWTHDGLKIDIQMNQAFGVDIEEFSENREWDLKKAPGRKDVKLYNCCPEPYPSLTFTLVLRRRAMFYVYNMVFPCGMIAMLSLFSFYLPPNSGERVSFVITVLLSMSVYMLMVTENMPQSADVPLVSKFFMAAMIQVALSLAATCVVIKFDTSKNPMGGTLKVIVNDWLAKLMFMKTKARKERRSTSGLFKQSITPITEKTYEKRNDDEGVIITDCLNNEEKEELGLMKLPSEDNMSKVVSELKVLTSKIHEEEAASKISEDWIFAAEVLDRFFMFLFTATIVLTCITVFVASPQTSLD